MLTFDLLDLRSMDADLVNRQLHREGVRSWFDHLEAT